MIFRNTLHDFGSLDWWLRRNRFSDRRRIRRRIFRWYRIIFFRWKVIRFRGAMKPRNGKIFHIGLQTAGLLIAL